MSVVSVQGGSGSLTLRGRLGAAAKAHGYGGGAYIHFGHGVALTGSAPAAKPRCIAGAGSFDENRYVEHDYLRVDPLVRRGRHSVAPFSWRLQDFHDAASEANPYLGVMAGWGMDGGVVAPIQDYAAGPAMLTLFSRLDRLSAGRTDPGALMEAASHIHGMARSEAHRADTSAVLSAREMDVLRLAAIGRTEVETAQALGLSRRGVQFHLARAMETLNAPNKTAAVARAVSLGFISV